MASDTPGSHGSQAARDDLLPSRVWVENAGTEAKPQEPADTMSLSAASALFRENFGKLSQQAFTGVCKEFLSPTSYRATIPGGFAYDAFNAKAKLQPHSIMRMLEFARIVSWYDPASERPRTFMDMDKLDSVFFMVSLKVKFSEEVYNPALEKRPAHINSEVTFLGNMSFTSKDHLYVGESGDSHLLEGDAQFVFIDLMSRKPTTPPDWFREKYAREVRSGGEPLIVPTLHVPESVTVLEDTYSIAPSDLDPNMHVNWTNYVRLYMDSLIKWHVRTYGFETNGDPFRRVKTLQQNFRGESRLGDTLNVSFWQNKTNQDKFHFLVRKSSRVINECTMEFYPQEKRSSKL
ncbi:uncharacterized protein LOC101852464 [Aplysia californica]|uniref:Uncharacterized protein LOC101852464 n=1 Tax=Aplysia californica TaxID=6500 RepID=A0ABM1VQZ4_APLCA|nr:uncharacterized protein LOC101852464 [Aplysia californica]